MNGNLLLTFNAGSSTIKIGLFETGGRRARRIAKGVVELAQSPLCFRLVEGPETFDVPLKTKADGDAKEMLGEIIGWLSQHFAIERVAAIGHRVVHGGDIFSGPAKIDDKVLATLDGFSTLDPLHQPECLRLIRAICELYPSLPQSASFDTAFHKSQAELVRRFALPREMHDAGIKRYGFHGLSYAFIAEELTRRAPDRAAGKVIVAHLGSGASLCGLTEGKSRDTSMGFSVLDGVPMATRCGALDPGVLLYLFGHEKRAFSDVENLLYHHSGLFGVSGISGDTRELLKNDKPEAREALDLFAFRIAGEVARIAATLGGVETLVFTAGIGEHQPEIRAAVCARLAWLGIEIDETLNQSDAATISTAKSRVAVLVIPTDEEQVIADEALKTIGV